jgi:hypothetical protein
MDAVQSRTTVALRNVQFLSPHCDFNWPVTDQEISSLVASLILWWWWFLLFRSPIGQERWSHITSWDLRSLSILPLDYFTNDQRWGETEILQILIHDVYLETKCRKTGALSRGKRWLSLSSALLVDKRSMAAEVEKYGIWDARWGEVTRRSRPVKPFKSHLKTLTSRDRFANDQG